MKCAADGCDRPMRARHLCTLHYQRWRKHGDVQASKPARNARRVCDVDGCDFLADSRGYCPMHYMRYRRHGDPLVVRVRGKSKKERSQA